MIDTQAFLWLTSAPGRLSAEARGILGDPANTVLLSYVVPWEIAIKAAIGKLPLPLSVHEYVVTRARRHSLEFLPITLDHVTHVATLPLHHRDPFDRLLIAQAQREGLPLLTADRRLAQYGVAIIAAA